MNKSLIFELPRIVEQGRKEAQKILDRLSSTTQIRLQTNELVLPNKDEAGIFRGVSFEVLCPTRRVSESGRTGLYMAIICL